MQSDVLGIVIAIIAVFTMMGGIMFNSGLDVVNQRSPRDKPFPRSAILSIVGGLAVVVAGLAILILLLAKMGWSSTYEEARSITWTVGTFIIGGVCVVLVHRRAVAYSVRTYRRRVSATIGRWRKRCATRVRTLVEVHKGEIGALSDKFTEKETELKSKLSDAIKDSDGWHREEQLVRTELIKVRGTQESLESLLRETALRVTAAEKSRDTATAHAKEAQKKCDTVLESFKAGPLVVTEQGPQQIKGLTLARQLTIQPHYDIHGISNELLNCECEMSLFRFRTDAVAPPEFSLTSHGGGITLGRLTLSKKQSERPGTILYDCTLRWSDLRRAILDKTLVPGQRYWVDLEIRLPSGAACDIHDACGTRMGFEICHESFDSDDYGVYGKVHDDGQRILASVVAPPDQE